MDNIVAFFVEGPTEIEFYKAIINTIRKVSAKPYSCKFKWIDLQGIGNYKCSALKQFNTLKEKNPDSAITVVMCIDTDVFETSKRPPINKKAVQETLISAGAHKAFYICASKSIEDWFLSDYEGVRRYLGSRTPAKRPKGIGQNVLKDLFRSSGKMYIKGKKVDGFIEKLDIQKIIQLHCKELKPLCSCIKADCKIICNKDCSKHKK